MIRIGDTVYVVYDDPRHAPEEHIVEKIGSKYITTTYRQRFYKDTLKSADDSTGWNANCQLYLSKQDYLNQVEERRIRKDLIQGLTQSLSVLPIRQLKALKELVNKFQK